jgi:hypothetical protein
MKRQSYRNVATHVAIVLVIAIVGAFLFQRIALVATVNYTVPSSIADNCSVDNSTDLSNWLDNLPPNATANFPTGACYLIQGELQINGTKNLTINANGASLKRTDLTAIDSQGTLPVVQLIDNANLTISGLGIDGGYDGTHGGPGHEGHSGLMLQCNDGVTMQGLNVNNIQGDFIILQAPINKGCQPVAGSLNTNISVTKSTFNNAGYHGITLESANGVTFNHDSFSNVAVDAIDAEYDLYSTRFVNGQPRGAAQDNISITDNTWTNCHYIWYASIQGQQPGVQQQNIVLTGNTFETGSPMIEIHGSARAGVPQEYWNDGFIFANNTIANGSSAKAVSGGSITTPFADSTMEIKNVADVTISNNTIPVADGHPGYFNNHPYLAALKATSVMGLTLTKNNFSGALGVLHPNSSGNTSVTECGNTYQVAAASVDASCTPVNKKPSPPPPATTTPTTTPTSTTKPTTATTAQSTPVQTVPATPSKPAPGGSIIKRIVPALSGGNPAVAAVEQQELSSWYFRYWYDAFILIALVGLADIIWIYIRRHPRVGRDLSGGTGKSKMVNDQKDPPA